MRIYGTFQTSTRIQLCPVHPSQVYQAVKHSWEKLASPSVEMQLCPLISLLNSQLWASGNHTEGTAAAEQGEEREEAPKFKIKGLESLGPFLCGVCANVKAVSAVIIAVLTVTANGCAFHAHRAAGREGIFSLHSFPKLGMEPSIHSSQHAQN